MQIGYGWSFHTRDNDPVCDRAALDAMGAERCFVVSNPSGRSAILEQAMGFLRPHDSFLVRSVERLGASICDVMNVAKALADTGASLRILDLPPGSESVSGDVLVEVARCLTRALETPTSVNASHDAAPVEDQAAPTGPRGRPMAIAAEHHVNVRCLVQEQGLSIRQVARRFGVSAATIYRILARP
ncbi:hypothetical protein GCM10019059_27550 [Camelimonas fluminis]|uniref:Helix-turn-helix domain-containing protein n=1 Tax=Camelimonas fluminis TaxID=1576911 RepID=A0ABV7UDD9_9HYPH|nr:helix-turn-helix domain-containing protein [Camelimonas fluminis]GHE66296.1 hypothetical protein GCM10019059_27550 [Camelimonas fluminis]